MMLPAIATPTDPAEQKRKDARRLRMALWVSLAAVAVLSAVFFAQPLLPVHRLAVVPLTGSGLVGILFAPLLHGGFTHLAMNCIAILILGTLAGSVYPRASLRALPLLWLGSGLVAWLLGHPDEHHLGASGITHGLMLMTFVLGLLRRERSAVAAAMIAFLLYGGMLVTVFPFEQGVSWQSHMGGALAGVLAAFLFRHADPAPSPRVYAYELEEAWEEAASQEQDALEPPRPAEIPVLWHREERESSGNVVPFPTVRRPE